MQLKVILIPVCFFYFRESMFHIHYLVIYKDVENPVSNNEELKKELEVFKAKLNGLWPCLSAAAEE